MDLKIRSRHSCLSASLSAMARICKDCDWLLKNFDLRAQARTEEKATRLELVATASLKMLCSCTTPKESLIRAKTVLAGM